MSVFIDFQFAKLQTFPDTAKYILPNEKIVVLLQSISKGNHEALCSFLIVRNVRTSNEIQERCNGSRVSSVDCIHFCISRYLTTSHERIGISVPRFVV